MSLCVAANNPNSQLTVRDHADLGALSAVSPPAPDLFQSSRAYLAASWTVLASPGLSPVRYEVSAGRSSQSSPQGVFGVVNDRVWRDVGLSTSCVTIVPAGRSLSVPPVVACPTGPSPL